MVVGNFAVLVKKPLQEIKGILDSGLHQAYKAVDNIKVQTYWQIGERIVREELKYKDRADYGVFLIENLSNDLDFRKRRLQEIIQFVRLYPIAHYCFMVDVINVKGLYAGILK